MKQYVFLLSFLFVLSGRTSDAQESMGYREFSLGSDLASVVGLTGAPASDLRAVHQRPVAMSELEWRPRYFSRDVSRETDPVELIVFSFYENRLFRIAVNYDPTRTEGMTEVDMIDAITAEYGPVSKLIPKASRSTALAYGAADVPVAIWGDSESSLTLLRSAYRESFRLIVASTRVEKLARTAAAEAVRLDAVEAPQRALAERKKIADDETAAREKAQIENKAVFKP